MSNGAITPFKAKVKEFRGVLQRMRPQLAMAMPEGFSVNRILRMSMTVFSQDEKLMNCTMESKLGSIMTAAQLGLYPDVSVLGHAYFVAYGNTCTFIAGYKGFIDLARRSGHVTSIMGYAAREGDYFEYMYGLNPDLKHKPSEDPEEERELTHFYSMARILNEPIAQFVVMSREQVEKIRMMSPMGRRNKGPWFDHYEQMGIKTSIRRLVKYLPLSSDLQRAVALDEHADIGLDQGLEAVGSEVLEGLADPDDPDVVDADVVETVEKTTSALDDLEMPTVEPTEYDKTWARGNELFGDAEWKKIFAPIKTAIGLKPNVPLTVNQQEEAVRLMEQAIGKGG